MNITALDPISLKEVVEINAAPFVVESHQVAQLVVYFESETNRQKYLQIAAVGTDFSAAGTQENAA